MKDNKNINNKLKEIPSGHKLKTRRDFLSHGLLSMSASTVMPSVFSMLYSRLSFAQECGMTANEMSQAQGLPVIVFDLAGGANIPGSNVMVGGPGGQSDFLQTYETLGLPQDMHPSNPGQLNEDLGLKFHADSSMLRGIMSNINAQMSAKVDGGVFATSSSDDTGNNPHNPMYWLANAGANGKLSALAGTNGNESGGRSMAPPESINPTLQPVKIETPQEALGLVNVGRLDELFNRDKAEKVLKTIQRLSEAKLQALSNQSLSDQIKDLVKCGYIQSEELYKENTPELIDPRNDNMVTSVFNLNDGDERKVGTMAKLLLDGQIGAATVSKGGYDYHNNTRSRGEVADFEAGSLIGKVMRLADMKSKNILIYVITDGGVAARNNSIDNSNNGRGKLAWSGDSGQRSSTFMLMYNGAGNTRPELRSGKRQIGWFKESGGVENSALLTSNSVTNMVKAVVANYLALKGEENKLSQVVGNNPFGSNLENYLIFNKL